MNRLVFSQSRGRKILIVYGSFSNSTKEIADYMKSYLENESTWIDTFSAENKKIELSKYDFIFIGSAIHGNAPHPKILEFIDSNRDELNAKKIAVFAVCGTITSSKIKKRENALNYPDKISNGLNVCMKEVFAGNIPASGKRSDDFMAKLFLGIITGDFRDWNKIKNWTLEAKSII